MSLEIYAVVRDLVSGKQAGFDFPIAEENVLERLGLNTEAKCELVITESSLPDILGISPSFDLVNDFAELTEDVEANLVKAVSEVMGYKAYDFVREDFNFDDCSLFYDVNTHRELGEYWIEESGFENLSKDTLEQYFDCESYGRDIDIENQGGFTDYGYLSIN
ncbi:antirestriction protein ArdA [Streptococcus gallolyticus]|nr:antirestriction protein ArdA [Streptococcus gallolyticus]MBY5040686.1 antirestriction protein ArdA [Streptococcus gallolyticus]